MISELPATASFLASRPDLAPETVSTAGSASCIRFTGGPSLMEDGVRGGDVRRPDEWNGRFSLSGVEVKLSSIHDSVSASR